MHCLHVHNSYKPCIHAGLDAFRGVQEAAIRAVFEGKDALVLMPTGAGKSLCYALPAAVLQGLVLVVSPLIGEPGKQS